MATINNESLYAVVLFITLTVPSSPFFTLMSFVSSSSSSWSNHGHSHNVANYNNLIKTRTTTTTTLHRWSPTLRQQYINNVNKRNHTKNCHLYNNNNNNNNQVRPKSDSRPSWNSKKYIQRFTRSDDRITPILGDEGAAKTTGPVSKLSSKSSKWNQTGRSANISHLLDQLLQGYDNHIRPNFGGPPIEVLIDFHIRSMGPISEIDMTYVIDCYFRQTWTDHRLAYKSMPIFETFSGQMSVSNNNNNNSDTYNLKKSSSSFINDGSKQQPQQPLPPHHRHQQKALALSVYMLDRIWKPPTYFLNSRQSHMHTITLPNKFVRIYSNGRVLYSSRMTIKANCPMNLENFPMDTQRCPLSLGSFGYTAKDLVYSWNPSRKVVINPDMKMSQFDLISVPVHAYNSSLRTSSMQQSFSMLVATFHFKRHMGSFVIEVYAPCIMLVVLSWVGFWINREATADRVTLGLTTVLTMTFLGLELRNDLPKVPYLTALDYFVYISFAFISATILEFGFVHFFTKIGSGEFYFMPIHEMNNTEEENKHTSGDATSGNRLMNSQRFNANHISRSAEWISGSGGGGGLILTDTNNVKRSVSCSLFGSNKEVQRSNTFTNEADIVQDARNIIDSRLPEHTVVIEKEAQLVQHCYQNRFYAFRNSLRNRLRHNFNRHNHNRFQQRSSNKTLTVQSSSTGNIIKSGICLNNSGSPPVQETTNIRVQLNSVSQIDRASRIIFPFAFVCMNFMYWFIYLRAERNIDNNSSTMTLIG